MGKTERILKSMKPQAEMVTPIGTDIILPNYSGLKGSGDVLADLDDRYLKLDCSNDPLTGDLTTNEDIYLKDNKQIGFGDDTDLSMRYSSSKDRVEIGSNAKNIIIKTDQDAFFDSTPYFKIPFNSGSTNTFEIGHDVSQDLILKFTTSGNDGEIQWDESGQQFLFTGADNYKMSKAGGVNLILQDDDVSGDISIIFRTDAASPNDYVFKFDESEGDFVLWENPVAGALVLDKYHPAISVDASIEFKTKGGTGVILWDDSAQQFTFTGETHMNSGDLIVDTGNDVLVTDMSSAGFVKNDATGKFTGGNSVDISSDTNLAVTAPIVLTGDTVSLDHTFRNRYANTADSTAIVNTTTETVFDKNYQFPANTFAVGDVIRVRASGRFSFTPTVTLRLKIKFGSVVLVDSGASVINGDSFWIEGDIIVRSLGGSGTVRATGWWHNNRNEAPESTAAAITVDTTAAQTCQVSAQWGTASALNTVALHNISIELIRTT